jgi:WD40 repeat protein
MAFLHDSQELIVVTKTGTIELWEIDEKNQSSTKIASVLSTGSGTLGVAISHDDSMFAQSNSDSTTHLWNIDSLRNGLGEESLLAILSGHRYKVMDPAFSLDDKMLATAGIDTTIRLWNIEAAIEEATLNKDKFVVNAIRGTLLGHSLGVTRVAFLRHDQLCSVSIDKTIRLWNVDSDAQPCKRIKGTPPKSSKQEMAGVYSCKRPKSLLSHGRDFYTVSNTGFVQQWVPLATETFKLLGHTTGVRSCVVLPDSQYALTGGSDGDASVIIWDIKRASAINQLWDLDVFGVKDLGVLQFDNRVILAVGLGYNNPSEYEDNVFSRIVLWDLTDVHHPKRLSHIDIGYSEGGIGRFATTKKGNRLLLSTLKGDVRAYEIDVDNEILFREIMHLEKVHSQAKQPKVPLGIIDGVGFLDDEGKFGVTAGIDGKVVFIDIAKKHQTIITDLGIPLYSLSVSPEHDEFAVGDFNGCIQRWSVEWESNKPQFVKKIPFEKEHKVPVKALTYHSDNTATRLVSGDNVGDIRLWDTKTNSWVFSIEGQFGSVFDLEFSPNGYHLISTSGGFRGKENAGFIWDGVPWEQQARLFGTRVRTMQAKNIVNDLLYDRPKTLEQFLFAIDDKAAGEQISSEVIDEAKLQATFAFNVPKNWRLMWWAENILFDPTATKENLQIALHWTKTALASAPLRMDTNAIHALALARVGAFDESELSANRALELELFKEPIKRSPQISASIMVRIAKTIVATHRGDQVAADLMSIEADDLIATTMNSFTHATNLIAHLEKTSSEVVSQVE